MATFLDDLDVVDQTAIEPNAQQYIAGQWTNGDPKLKAAGGVAYTGGVLLDRDKYLPDFVKAPPGWADQQVTFANGGSIAAVGSARPELAVVRTRFRWFRVVGGVATYYPLKAYEEGMRGHLQALCGVRGFDFPIQVTFKGMASKLLNQALRDFTARMSDASARTLREQKRPATKFPRFAFYLPLTADKHQKTGQNGQESIITPPVLVLPETLDAAALANLYVGRDRLVELQQLYHDSAEWAAAWDRPGAEESADTAEWDNHPDAQPTQTAAQAAGLGGSSRNAPPPPDNWEDF